MIDLIKQISENQKYYTIETIFFHQELICIIIKHHMSSSQHRCGYVAVPPKHVAYGLHCNDFNLIMNVHGGVTFSSESPEFGIENAWWIGFDTNHICDMDDPKSLNYCKNECKRMADQLSNMVKKLVLTIEEEI